MNENKSFDQIKQALEKALLIDKHIHGPDENGHLWIRFKTPEGQIKITFDQKDRQRMEDLLAGLPSPEPRSRFVEADKRTKPEGEMPTTRNAKGTGEPLRVFLLKQVHTYSMDELKKFGPEGLEYSLKPVSIPEGFDLTNVGVPAPIGRIRHGAGLTLYNLCVENTTDKATDAVSIQVQFSSGTIRTFEIQTEDVPFTEFVKEDKSLSCGVASVPEKVSLHIKLLVADSEDLPTTKVWLGGRELEDVVAIFDIVTGY